MTTYTIQEVDHKKIFDIVSRIQAISDDGKSTVVIDLHDKFIQLLESNAASCNSTKKFKMTLSDNNKCKEHDHTLTGKLFKKKNESDYEILVSFGGLLMKLNDQTKNELFDHKIGSKLYCHLDIV